jgi:DNA-binding NarL/FixJ family response regulator
VTALHFLASLHGTFRNCVCATSSLLSRNDEIIRILVVDDFADWRHCILEKVRENRSFQVIGVASDGLEAVLKAEELQPDLILLDISLPEQNGIEAARTIRKVAPDSKILFLTEELDVALAQTALSAGGHGYVIKSDADDELIVAIETVLLGKAFVSRRLTDKGI